MMTLAPGQTRKAKGVKKMEITTEMLLEEALEFIADDKDAPCVQMTDLHLPEPSRCGECTAMVTETTNEVAVDCWRAYFRECIQKREGSK